MLAGMLSVSMLCSPVLASGNVSRERLEESRARQNADLLIVTGKLDGAEIGGLATLAVGVGAGIGAGVTRAVLQKRLAQRMAQNEELTGDVDFYRKYSDPNGELQTQLGNLRTQNEELTGQNRELVARNEELAGQNRGLVARNEELAGQNKKLTGDVDFYRKYSDSNGELQTQLGNLRTQNEELALKNHQLTQDVDVYRQYYDQNKELQSQLENLRTRNKELVSLNEKSRWENDHLRFEHKELTKEAGKYRWWYDRSLEYERQNSQLQTQNEGLRAENERLAARERKLVTQNGELALKNSQLTQEVDFYRRFKANSEVQAQLEKLETENAQLLAQNGKLQTQNVSLQSDLVREEILREAQAAENRHLRKQWWDMTKAQRIDDILKLEQEYAVSLRNKGGKLLHLGDLYSQEQIYFLNQLVWQEAEIPSVIKYNGRAFAIKEGYEETFFRSVYEIYNNSRWPFKKEMVVTPKTGALFAMVYRKAEMMPELVGRWLTDQYSSGGIDFVVLKSYVKEVPVSAVAKSSLRLVGKKVVLKSLPAAVGVGLLGGAFAWANSQAQEQEILARVEANPSLWMNLSDEDFERVAQSDKLAESYLAFNDALHELAQIPAAELQRAVQEAQQYEKQQQIVRAQQLRHELTGRLAF